MLCAETVQDELLSSAYSKSVEVAMGATRDDGTATTIESMVRRHDINRDTAKSHAHRLHVDFSRESLQICHTAMLRVCAASKFVVSYLVVVFFHTPSRVRSGLLSSLRRWYVPHPPPTKKNESAHTSSRVESDGVKSGRSAS